MTTKPRVENSSSIASRIDSMMVIGFRPDENIKVMVGPLRALQNARHGLAAYVEPSMMTEGT
jgi:hypothetical protein